MKRIWKKAVALILAVVMTLQLVPSSAYAATGSGSGNGYNEQVMAMLEDICDTEEDAERYYEMLEEYGFMDSNGNAAESWSITMDGAEVTLQEIRDLLNDENCDKSKYVMVDGTAVTLEDLETMIQIEDYIAYLEETYYSPQEWSEEQLANLDDLVNQINTDGIEILAGEDETDEELVWQPSVKHEVRLDVNMAVNGTETEIKDKISAKEGDILTFTVKPSEEQTKDITFTWRVVNGSAEADRNWDIQIEVKKEDDYGETYIDYESVTADEVREMIDDDDYEENKDTVFIVDGEEMTLEELAEIIDDNEWTVTIPEGSKEAVCFSVEVGKVGGENGLVQGEGTLFIQIFDVVNALFEDKATRWEKQVSVEACDEFSYYFSGEWSDSFYNGEDYYVVMKCTNYGSDYDVDHSEGHYGQDWSSSLNLNVSKFNINLNGENFAAYFYPKEKSVEFSRYIFGVAFDNLYLWLDSYWSNVTTVRNPTITFSLNVGDQTKKSGPTTLSDFAKSETISMDLPTFSLSGGKELWDGSSNYVFKIDATLGEWTVPNSASRGAAKYEQSILDAFPSFSISGFGVDIYETTQTTDAVLTAPAGTYYAGQTIPVTASFGFPMYITDKMYIEVNGERLYPEEAGTIGNTCTFLYTVKDADTSSLFLTGDEDGYNLSGTGANELDIIVTLDTAGAAENEDGEGSYISKNVVIDTPDKSAAIVGVDAVVNNPITKPVLEVTVKISSDNVLTAWLTQPDELVQDDVTGVRTSKSLTILYNGVVYPLTTGSEFITGSTLTASISIPLDTTDHTYLHEVELLIEGEVYMEFYATAKQVHAEFLTADDFYSVISVYQSDGETRYEYVDNDSPYTIWVQDAPVICASIELEEHDEEWSFENTGSATVLMEDENGDYLLEDETADFLWWIGDEDGNPDTLIANIDSEGNIIPAGSAGTAYVYLTALNGDDKLEDGGSRHVTVRAYQLFSSDDRDVKVDYLRFDVGLTPFLYIPYNEVTTVAGLDLTIYWTSNLCDKNEGETIFEVTLTSNGKTICNDELTGTADDPASGYTVSGSSLTYDYGNSENNTYELTVSSEYEGVTYDATATITLQPNPAVVTLGALDTYYIADDPANINITWDLENFGYFEDEESGQFLFLITTDEDEEPIASVTDPGTDLGGGSYSGSYTFSVSDVIADPDVSTSYRKIYTVTIAAKNGSDSTYSYDSFLLYVYDRDALDIWINGESADGVSLSNVKAISEMTQDEILDLNRDIYLKAMVSVNYGEYAWTELTDQMEWASSNSKVASVNYQQGTLYENIEHFSYTTYRPTTEFGITGLKDGEVTITATHSLTGISDSVTVDVERLDEQLYLFQCYPQTATELTYTNGDGKTKTITSADDGSAAIYEESGIASDVYCQSTYDNSTYLGTIYNQNLKSGEGDWTLLERYPCNNITLRQAAYAYMYIKNPDGTPYTESITVRGGVYLDGKYIADGLFDYNGKQGGDATQAGYEDYTLTLGADGKLEVTMDQTQWGTDTGAVNAWDDVYYVFEIDMGNGGTELYPMIVTIDATISEAAYVGNGEAVVTFRKNPSTGEHPFIVGQMMYHGGSMESVLDGTGSVGPSATSPSAELYTIVMWWGEPDTGDDASAQLFASDGTAIATAEGKYEITQEDYPFSDKHTTTYSVMFDESTIGDLLDSGESTGLYLEYYKDGTTLTRREDLTFKLVNMIGVQEVTDSDEILDEIQNMGLDMETYGSDASNMGTTDTYMNAAISFVSDTDFTNGSGSLFNMQLAPTSDPTKFLGFVEVNIGGLNMDDDDDDDSQIYYADSVSDGEWEYWPGKDELMTLAGKKSVTDYFADAKENLEKGTSGKAVDDHDLSYSLGGYMETLIYYDYNSASWKMQIISGGFNVGGGFEWCWNFNTFVGFIPFTATVKIGVEAEVSMDAITAAYYESGGSTALGNDFLTQLRMFLYLYFFAGVGIDYAVIAFKLGVYGEIDFDMSFDWLNRKYLTDGVTPVTNTNTNPSLSGQNFAGTGEIGLELVVKLLFISYEKVLFSYSFDLFDKSTGQWTNLENVWKSDQNAYDDIIISMFDANSLSTINIGGTQMLTINLAATKEDVSYLESGSTWGSGIKSLKLDSGDSGLNSLNKNSYAFADPVVTDDGSIVAFLGVPSSYGITGEGGIESENVSAMFAVKSGDTYVNPGVIPDPVATDEAEENTSDNNFVNPVADGADPEEDDDESSQSEVTGEDQDVIESEPDIGGYGDSELSLAGSGKFAVAAWTRQMVDIAKDDGAVLTEEDQRMMLDGTDIFVSVYSEGSWTTTRIENGGADLAPVVATNGSNAIVAWRSVAVSDETKDLTDFDQKDTILYKIYSNGSWSDETFTLYNGTSGNVKGITAEMLSDGTAAVAYAIDTDTETETITDREIVYAVIDTTSTDANDEPTGEVKRNVRATNDAFLDENPQLTTVMIGGQERFLLGWYTEQSGVEGIDGSDDNSGDTTSDIRLIDFDSNGNATQLMPDSISAAATAANVSITSNFAFTKGSESTDIDNLSIIWTERANAISSADSEDENIYVEKDILKAVKFYSYGQGQVSFTGAVDVAEMPDGTLIDSFDAYTTDGTTIKAVIMGTMYGENGVVRKQGVTEGDDLVSYEVPSSETSIYTATESYGNSIEVPYFMPDYEMLKLGASADIWFGIDNTGIDAVTGLTITVGDSVTEYTDLNLLPGGTLQIYADYRVPYDAVRDEYFTVTATFKDGSEYTYGSIKNGDDESEDDEDEEADNLIYMNLPDIAVTDASIIREENGERDILVKLNNTSDAALGESSGTYVRLGFYSDSTCESPITGLDAIVIDNEADLEMIDEGGYSVLVTFDVASYLEDYYGELTEIPETGVNVYIMAEVIDDSTDEAQGEYNPSNNYGQVTCENLQFRTGQDVTLSSIMDINGSNVTVTVDLQNTRLTTTETGNVIVTLIGEGGEILAQKQSYNGTSGLITLAGEAKDTEEFTFKGITDAFTVSVIYTDMILDGDDIPEGLDTLIFPSLEENVTLDDFTWDENSGAYVYSITVKDLTWVSMIAVAKDAKASITVNGETTDFYSVAMNLDLTPGETNVITIDVKNRNGIVTTYIFTIYDETDEVPVEELIGEGTGGSGAAGGSGTGSDGSNGTGGESGTSSGTGDSGRPLMMFIIMIACAAVIAGIIVSGRRKRFAGKKE